MQPVTVTLDQVRVAFLRLVSSETLLVGHSLENDLLVLHVTHSRNCVDTAALFPHPAGFPRRLKLKQLAADFLQQQIQRGKAGHDSVEDARSGLGVPGERRSLTLSVCLAGRHCSWLC